MKLEDLIPGHAKRAEKFRAEANIQVLATPGIWKARVYNVGEQNYSTLMSAADYARKPKKREVYLRRADEVDLNSAVSTAIGVSAISTESQILIDLLMYLDESAALRGAQAPTGEPRVFEFNDHHHEIPWLLNAIWFFADSKRS